MAGLRVGVWQPDGRAAGRPAGRGRGALYDGASALPVAGMKSNSNSPAATTANVAPQLLTRAEVARRLGVGASTVRRLEGGALQPIRGNDGVHRFDAGEVDAYRAVRSDGRRKKSPSSRPAHKTAMIGAEGKHHARAFRLFEAGRSHAEVVIETALPSDLVRQLYVEWRAGYREPPAPPPRIEEDDDAIRAREAAEWAEWERRMQALSSEFETRPPRLAALESAVQRLDWRRPGRPQRSR